MMLQRQEGIINSRTIFLFLRCVNGSRANSWNLHKVARSCDLPKRAAIYQTKPENRHLPTLIEFLKIRIHANPVNWKAREKRMMRQAARYHAFRVSVFLTACGLLAAVGFAMNNEIAARQDSLQAERLVEGLLAAEITRVPQLTEKLIHYRQWANPLLTKHLESDDRDKRLRASLALLPESPSQAEYLMDRLLEADPDEVMVLLTSLVPYRRQFSNRLWRVLDSPDHDDARRLRAACVLASFDPDNESWSEVAERVASILSTVNPTYSHIWMNALRPVRNSLFAPLAAIFADTKRPANERALATDLLSQYAADSPPQLAKLCLIAEPHQFLSVFPKLQRHGAIAIDSVLAELDPSSSETDNAGTTVSNIEVLNRRRANAFVTLARLGEVDNLWRQLRHSSDPTVRSWLIHSFASLRMNPDLIIERIKQEQDDSVRRALLLALGEYESRSLPQDSQERLATTLAKWYRNDNDAGIHAAVEWLRADGTVKRIAKRGRETRVSPIQTHCQVCSHSCAKSTRNWPATPVIVVGMSTSTARPWS